MITAPVGACLVIADISGYTRYLSGVELDHAQDILADLMGTVVEAFRPGFTLSKLEGDAVFMYRIDEMVDGSVLLDTIEGAYFAFRNRLMSIRQASVCECQACANIGGLDLKAVVHYGEVAQQAVMGHTELVGADVIVVHRMLKNAIDIPAYTFITDRCIAASELQPEKLGMERHVETYEHIGEVSGWVRDLERAWSELRDRTRVYFGDDEADVAYHAFYAAPPQLVWEHISVPSLRVKWNYGLDAIEEVDESGRRRPGTINHCMHGRDVIVQEFLDWRPPRYHTIRNTMPDGFVVITTQEVEPVDGGAVLHERFVITEEAEAAAFDELVAFLDEGHRHEVQALTALLAGVVDEKGLVEEPDLPTTDEDGRLATAVAADPQSGTTSTSSPERTS